MQEIPNLNYILTLSKGNNVFEQTLIGIIKKELPIEIEAYKSHLINGNFTETAGDVHKINHKIKILGLVKGCKTAERYRLNLLDNSVKLKSDFEGILKSLSVFINRV